MAGQITKDICYSCTGAQNSFEKVSDAIKKFSHIYISFFHTGEWRRGDLLAKYFLSAFAICPGPRAFAFYLEPQNHSNFFALFCDVLTIINYQRHQFLKLIVTAKQVTEKPKTKHFCSFQKVIARACWHVYSHSSHPKYFIFHFFLLCQKAKQAIFYLYFLVLAVLIFYFRIFLKCRFVCRRLVFQFHFL